MAQLTYGDVTIRYEDVGTGFPILLLAPGALNATVEAWQRAAVNPLASFDGEFRMVAMDHRNAGQSVGPLVVADPWGAYVQDQITLLDHLGIDRAHVFGCCIGVSYALKMAEMAPGRVASMVLEQPIGITDENREHWRNDRRAWADQLVARRPELDAETAERFGAAMWDEGEFVVSVTREYVQSCPIPMVVLPGVDSVHPRGIALQIAELAPNSELIDPWKTSPELVAAAVSRVRDFLNLNTPE
jgi:pimeloyl-ACP methyl ester carboxylesterase